MKVWILFLIGLVSSSEAAPRRCVWELVYQPKGMPVEGARLSWQYPENWKDGQVAVYVSGLIQRLGGVSHRSLAESLQQNAELQLRGDRADAIHPDLINEGRVSANVAVNAWTGSWHMHLSILCEISYRARGDSAEVESFELKDRRVYLSFSSVPGSETDPEQVDAWVARVKQAAQWLARHPPE
ncbi:hypothetical protein K2X33_10555 [bacterium]|nr:hypothetical protein [bacterium]